MNIFQAFQQLIHEKLLVLTRNLGVKTDDIMKICIHVIGYNIELPERGQIAWQYQIMHLDNLMILAFFSKNLTFS